MKEIRIDQKGFIAMLRDAGVVPPGTPDKNVKALIVWENNTTEALFDPAHGGDGLLLQIEEEAEVAVCPLYVHECVGCKRHFTRMALCDGRGRFLGWCIDCDASKDSEILAKITGGSMPGSAFR